MKSRCGRSVSMSLSARILLQIIYLSMSFLQRSKVFAESSVVGRFTVQNESSFAESRVKTRIALVFRSRLFVAKVTGPRPSGSLSGTLFCVGMGNDSSVFRLQRRCESAFGLRVLRGSLWVKKLW